MCTASGRSSEIAYVRVRAIWIRMSSKSRITLVLLVAAITLLGGAAAATAGPLDAAAVDGETQPGNLAATDTPMDDMSTETPMDDDMSTDTPMDDDMSTDTPMDDDSMDEEDDMNDDMDDEGGLPVVPLAAAGLALVGLGLVVAYRR